MAKKTKYYAVRKGAKTGVFDNWEECSKAITGFAGAEYKSFLTEDEAKAYLNDDNIYLKQVKEDISEGYIVAYTDGSFDSETNRFSYGVHIFDDALKEIDLCAAYENKYFDGANNIVGEVFGVISALGWARSFGYTKIKIYHDYEGLAKWASGEWNANSKVAQYYVDKLLKEYAGVIEYVFVKVKGHSNNPYNNKADQLADLALKDGQKITFKGANSFVVTNFTESDLIAIVELVMSENTSITREDAQINNGQQITLKVGSKKTIIKLFNNGKLLVQGKPTIVFQMILTNISTLLGTDNLIELMRNAYRWTVRKSDVDGQFENLCYNIPTNYPSNCVTLIRQALINKICYVESEDYAQYAFPALKALEGHIKFLMQKANIHYDGRTIGSCFTSIGNSFVLSDNVLTDNMNLKTNIEKCYNYYHVNRHTIFHFGDLMGNIDTSRMIETKRESDEIIDTIIKMINDTVI